MDIWFVVLLTIGMLIAGGMAALLVAFVRRQLRDEPQRWLHR
ncbi:hypothetical protein ACIBG8_06415 [Nonomuraea sp. NPDC050556]